MAERSKKQSGMRTFAPKISPLAAGNVSAGDISSTGPRIYNLFPSLLGSVRQWTEHLPRIADMQFNWIYLNPFHAPGYSGSLYAIKNPYALSDWAGAGIAPQEADTALREFVASAKRHGIAVMMDLVINHTAKDADLFGEHPEWYRRNADGSPYSPRAVDPDDPQKVTIWEDLAELDYEMPSVRAALVDYWSTYIQHYAGLGFNGFRCDAAYQVPAPVWKALIEISRRNHPDLVFFAETLGCTTEQVAALAGAGFNYIFNSAKWWDFAAPWLLDQYDQFRLIAPSIAFPESHDTERLASTVDAANPAAISAVLKFHLVFAATFSAGYMMPIGYEYGFRQKLDVVYTRPESWETTGIDIGDFVTAVNRMKATVPALNVEGYQRRITAPAAPVVGLLRLSGGHVAEAEECALLLFNPDRQASHEVAIGPLFNETGGYFSDFTDVTPFATETTFSPAEVLNLEPLEARIYRGRKKPRAADQGESKRAEVDPSEFSANRVAIENVYPEIDGGRFAIKRTVGDVLEIWADIFSDGHDKLQACIKYRPVDATDWSSSPMALYDNDRWVGRIGLTENADYLYTIEAWRDLFGSWRNDIIKKRDAGQKIALELEEGLVLIDKAATRAKAAGRDEFAQLLAEATRFQNDPDQRSALLLDPSVHEMMLRWEEPANLSRYQHNLRVMVDRQAALYSAWYELMPRSQSPSAGRSGNFDDVIARLPYVRDMGFDVLYFPPIHPIGSTNRKGRNNSLTAKPEDPGSPYAIGAAAGGHTAIHPALGTLDDFDRLVHEAHRHGLEIALDFAIQCSPDHPWIREHPEWFDWRPDGTIKFAENPPKKYEDIVNLHLYRDALPGAWYALRDVILFWINHGVRIFRVDNPHTKPLPFWEWMIADIRRTYPEAIFLAEAFTRPKMMKRLAKVGFAQSYTYFTWRTTKQELTDYLLELTRSEAREYYRPNFFANTPDINPYHLQTGGRPMFIIRATLAATLSSAYGIYSGFELCEATPVPGKEEYLNSEKYEIKVWDWNRPGHIRDHITRLNRIRRDNPALHQLTNLTFYNAFNDQILLYGKMTATKDNAILIAVNLDTRHMQSANFEVPLWEFGLADDAAIDVEDLLTGKSFRWQGKIQHMALDPQINPCAIWRLSPVGGRA
ncbi:maltotransferase domain-containing protein [Dongia soli]|uniref:Alpha-1,4-glucan:maltose-1-phosphate maltosyltransferase n=1 Tax=Dongia soli TaxID=600628 RepID=A0ABU5E5U1_9PROT|nr:maltotransferase domain-containing protein [Dongia soli]MDY0881626.1 maltotransferase domain-containing protein [Dongia soli]